MKALASFAWLFLTPGLAYAGLEAEALPKFSEIPLMGTLHTGALRAMEIVFLAWIVKELLAVARGGKGDFTKPFLQVGVGYVSLWLLPEIPGALYGTSLEFFSAFEQSTGMTQLVEGFALSASSFSTCHFGFMDAVKTLFNSATWLFFIASISFTLLQVTKLVILDAIWPVLVIVVSFAGVFAIPLGLLPGIESFRGWIRSLIEVALWPIIIAMILAVMTATFKQTISETLTAQPQEERIALVTCDDLRLMLQADETNPDRLIDPALRREQTSIIQKMLKMTALTIATILFLLGTPLLAGSLTRGQTAEALGGLLGGKAAGVAKEPLQTVRATERDDVKRAHRAQQGTRATRGFIHRIRTAMGSSGDST